MAFILPPGRMPCCHCKCLAQALLTRLITLGVPHDLHSVFSYYSTPCELYFTHKYGTVL